MACKNKCKKSCKTAAKYTLIVDTGAYFSDSIFGLFWEMTKHRFQHLMGGDGWMD
jgi:hypothetical protein